MVGRLMIDELEDIRKEALLSLMDVLELSQDPCGMTIGCHDKSVTVDGNTENVRNRHRPTLLQSFALVSFHSLEGNCVLYNHTILFL
jgi:hypothetical protein